MAAIGHRFAGYALHLRRDALQVVSRRLARPRDLRRGPQRPFRQRRQPAAGPPHGRRDPPRAPSQSTPGPRTAGGALPQRPGGQQGLDIEQILRHIAVETVIYRVAQEALTNAVRHSRGSRIGVRLAFEAGRGRLTVSDNGIGLPAILQVQGLTGMRERARLVDGRLEVSSPPVQGVRATLTVPTQESAAG